MLQDERSGTDAGTTAAAQPGLWQIGRNICGFGVEQQAAVVRPRAHEAFSPGLIGATRARSLARGSLTHLFQLGQPCGHTVPGPRAWACCGIHPGPRLMED